jgi:hypothetical protein
MGGIENVEGTLRFGRSGHWLGDRLGAALGSKIRLAN